MKKALLLLLFLPIFSFAQEDRTYNYFGERNSDQIRINYKAGTKGSPYLYNNWKEGYVVINDSIISSQDAIQFDMTKGDLIIGAGKNKQTGVILTDNSITGFAIVKDVNSGSKHFFAKINPNQFKESGIDRKYFEVISNLENSNFLIKEEKKYLYDPNKSRGYQTQNSIPQEYKTRTYYYIKDKSGKYVKTKLSKGAILKRLSDKKSELKSYISAKKINFNKEQDVARLMNYYHTLI